MIQPSRRRFLQGFCAAGAAGPLAAGCATLSDRPFFARHRLPIGIQLYTLGDLTRNDLDGTLRQVAAIGYQIVLIDSNSFGARVRPSPPEMSTSRTCGVRRR